MAKTEIEIINDEMDIEADFVDNITAADVLAINKLKLKQEGFKFAWQQKQNVLSRHYVAAMIAWLIEHGYEAGDEKIITLEMKVALFLADNPGTELNGEALELAAAQAWWDEMDAIDASINSSKPPLAKATLKETWDYVEGGKAKVKGFDEKIGNFTKSRIKATLKG